MFRYYALTKLDLPVEESKNVVRLSSETPDEIFNHATKSWETDHETGMLVRSGEIDSEMITEELALKITGGTL
jgi:hypothetical protein